jgi:hypothetical protein
MQIPEQIRSGGGTSRARDLDIYSDRYAWHPQPKTSDSSHLTVFLGFSFLLAFMSRFNKTIMDLDWDSEDDPRNPYNWSEGKRMYHTLCVSFYAFAVYVFSSPLSSCQIMAQA